MNPPTTIAAPHDLLTQAQRLTAEWSKAENAEHRTAMLREMEYTGRRMAALLRILLALNAAQPPAPPPLPAA